MRLSEIQHQDRAVSILRRSLRSGRTHHAYLFAGPQGVGKRTAAMALAARLLCTAEDVPPDADACGRCPSCRLIASDNHPDFHLVHRGLHKQHPEPSVRRSKGLFLAVDVVRHFLIARAGLSPSQGRARVFLIIEAERMNDGAQNALLKTLEEPPGRTRLILVTSSEARLLPTIRSRVQTVPFGPLPPVFVEEQLQRQAKLDTRVAHSLARLCDGRLGAALHWHRIGLLGTLDDVALCISRLEHRDPSAFAKGLIETAELLAKRTVEAAGRVQDDAAADADGDDDEDASDVEENDEPAGRAGSRGGGGGKSRTGSRAVATDDFRTAMKLLLMLAAALFRDALILRDGADTGLMSLPAQQRLSAVLAEGAFAAPPEDCIAAVAEAESMLDRNVNNQLLCERLAAALVGAVEPVLTL
jgi:DNA polymerase III delta' subunit